MWADAEARGLAADHDLGLRVEHVPDAQVDLELFARDVGELDAVRGDHDRALADALEERSQAVEVRRIMKEEPQVEGPFQPIVRLDRPSRHHSNG